MTTTDDEEKDAVDSDEEVVVSGKDKLFSSVAEAAAALENATKVKPLPHSSSLKVDEEMTRKESSSSSSDDGEFRAKQLQIEKLS